MLVTMKLLRLGTESKKWTSSFMVSESERWIREGPTNEMMNLRSWGAPTSFSSSWALRRTAWACSCFLSRMSFSVTSRLSNSTLMLSPDFSRNPLSTRSWSTSMNAGSPLKTLPRLLRGPPCWKEKSSSRVMNPPPMIIRCGLFFSFKVLTLSKSTPFSGDSLCSGSSLSSEFLSLNMASISLREKWTWLSGDSCSISNTFAMKFSKLVSIWAVEWTLYRKRTINSLMRAASEGPRRPEGAMVSRLKKRGFLEIKGNWAARKMGLALTCASRMSDFVSIRLFICSGRGID